ncbi:coiled-coil domain-containing protein 66 isoform X2 [Latimeria chalumnae]|uniref:coiled-coil domain-containing protein 66 isoform X2 n=1 Tax=Latimeria chalumnae TaxID=7897 RepID=UPI0003C1AD56|nr:PREDICTED: coiled-coil domain-containing protein 66 isoform X2 [Latimeria chalumnae]|eukprot:XP_006005815.1 PREDICTED: coiled-coil domain-containing protein 66 isoform X2 [Latimeria chalumnae]
MVDRDGLKLETQILNGKTKLILTSYGVESKAAKKINFKGKTQKYPLKGKHATHEVGSNYTNSIKSEKPSSKATVNRVASEVSTKTEVAKEIFTSVKTTSAAKGANTRNNGQITQGTGEAGNQDLQKSKSIKKPTNSKQQPPKKQKISSEVLRDSLVCLTQEQLQQILETIGQATKNTPSLSWEVKGHQATEANNPETGEECIEGLQNKSGEGAADSNSHVLGTSEQENAEQLEGSKIDSNGLHMESNISKQEVDFFSMLGERERGRDLLEAKKAQWKKELDEQVALKKQQHKEETLRNLSEWGKPESGNPVGATTGKLLTLCQAKVPLADDSGPQTLEDQRNKTTTAVDKTECNPVPPQGPVGKASTFSSPDLPAAIRTAFVLGEAAPLEHPFSAVKRQQQKKWLEELEKQREEAKQRKLQEKMKRLEAEDHDKWAAHFDSFKKKLDPQPLLPQSTIPSQQPENLEVSPEFQESSASFAPSSTLAPFSPSGTESLGRASVVTNLGQSQKNSFLRTMTALLDPAEIDEREKRRQKQFEHQKAIAIQVEERRRQKQLEEERRQQEELEEELRLEQEREKIQKQFEEDVLKQKQKEELLTRKTNELYQSMQRAQEQALRLKQEHRMRELARKGHDISNLQRTLGGDASRTSFTTGPSSLSGFVHDDGQDQVSGKISQLLSTAESPRKDTGVQTDDIEVLEKVTNPGTHTESIIGQNLIPNTPDISIEYKEPSNSKVLRIESKHPAQKISTEKENVDKQEDLYDQFARTEKRPIKNSEKHGRKPEWNTNKPVKKYIPASERYPSGLKREREENKMRRQMELLHLAEKNTPENLYPKKKPPSKVSPERSPSPQAIGGTRKAALRKEENSSTNTRIQDHLENRSHSPPVPAVKNRLHELHQKQTNPNISPVHPGNNEKGKKIHEEWEHSPGMNEPEIERPSSSQFIPYVRTNEIYHLDPDAPMSRPSTHDPQYRKQHSTDPAQRQIYSSDHVKDPLYNPELLRSRDRQQAILKGLSELRQGLLQKQRELETAFTPSVHHQEGNISPSLQ